MPQSEVKDAELGQFHNALEPRSSDLGASIQIDTAEVAQLLSHRLDAAIRNAAALADVERLQIRQRVRQPDETFVRHVTGAER